MKLKEWFKDNYNLVFLGILVLGIGLRLWIYFKTLGQAVWWDEADYLVNAQTLMGMHDYYALNVRRPFLFPLVWGLIIKLFNSEALIRLTEVFMSTMAVWFAYFIGKEMYSKKVGLIACFLSAVFWQYLFFTGRIMTDLPMVAFYLGAVYFFWRAYVNKKGWKNYVWFGVFLGLTLFTRGSAALTLGIFGVFILVKDRLNFLKNKHLWLALVIMIIVIAPYFMFMQLNIDSGNAVVEYTGLTSNRFTRGMGLAGFGQYINFFPSYMLLPFLIVLVGSLILYIMDLVIKGDLVLKQKGKKGLNEVFLLGWILLPFVFFSVLVDHMEPRYIMILFPALFLIMGNGLVWLEKFIAKYQKEFATTVIVLILLLGGYFQVTYAGDMVDAKVDTYAEVMEAAEWMSSRVSDDQLIISASNPQTIYYSLKYAKGFEANQSDFEQQLVDYDVKYATVSVFEMHPEWAYTYFDSSSDFVPVKTYYDDYGNVLLVIYEYQA
jgi:4-amino-4-deoxy-L-arabinose transferase-like glycosyltransferase